MIRYFAAGFVISVLASLSSQIFAETLSDSEIRAENTVQIQTSRTESMTESMTEGMTESMTESMTEIMTEQSGDALDSQSLNNREVDPYLVFYGNYCGIGNKSPDYSKPGIDLLDDLCKIHDFCYETFGHGACNCDMELMNNLITYQHELPHSPQAKVIMTTMRMLFGKNSCDKNDKTQI